MPFSIYRLEPLSKMNYRRNRGIASRFTQRPEVREYIFTRDNNKCVFCGSSDNLTIDHIIPVYLNGGNEYSNLQTLCNICNAGKPIRVDINVAQG